MTQAVHILAGNRTAIGTFGGSLSAQEPSALGASVAVEAMKRASVDPAEIGHVVYGNVIPTGPHDAYLGRAAALGAGIPEEAPAMTLNRLTGLPVF